jgi:hypothetical protein
MRIYGSQNAEAQQPQPQPQHDLGQQEVPLRARKTNKRVGRGGRPQSQSDPYDAPSARSTTSAFRNPRTRPSSAADDDYVVVDVDPLDPFSASRGPNAPRWGAGDDDGGFDDPTDEDWLPIAALMGVAGLLWLASVLGSALPAASPVVGL